jgi:signal recognition particle GTPase
MASRFYVERNLFSYLAHATIPTEKSYYDDDEVYLSALTRKPVSYLLLGKPGAGVTTLAAKLARKMNLVHIYRKTSVVTNFNRHKVQSVSK